MYDPGKWKQTSAATCADNHQSDDAHKSNLHYISNKQQDKVINSHSWDVSLASSIIKSLFLLFISWGSPTIVEKLNNIMTVFIKYFYSVRKR